jgi:transposase-like protein
MKTEQREQARHLRRTEGASIKEIARRTGAAQSSISRWVRDVELSEDQKALLLKRAREGQVKGRTMTYEMRRDARQLAQEEGRGLARAGDAFHCAGCMLYWAEREKSRNSLRFCNSDPEMVKFFVSFLRQYFDVGDDEIKLTCHLFADHVEGQREIEHFWLRVARLSETSLRKSHVNVYSKYSAKKRMNRLPYGTVTITVHRTRVVQSIYGSIQEYGGFDRPAWLE